MNTDRRIGFLKGRMTMVAAGILMWLTLELAYRSFVAPVYDYAGFHLSIDRLKYVEAWTIYFLLIALTPLVLKRPSDFFVSILLFALVAPLLVFYSLTDQPRSFLYYGLMTYLLVDVFRRGRPIRMPAFREGQLLALAAVVTVSIFVSIWFIWSGALKFFNLDLTSVYDFREDASAVIDAGVMAYVNTWTYKVFGPALLAIGLWKRNLSLALLAMLLHIYWFGVSSHKSVLFYPMIVIGLWWWFGKHQALSALPLGISLMAAFALTVYFVADYNVPAGLMIRRVFFVVARNTFDYYEFFAEHGFIWWSNSILSAWLDYPHDLNPARLIGSWRGTGSHANSTFLSTGFMHAGLFGLTLYGVLVGLLLRVIDSIASSGIPVWVAVSVPFAPVHSLLLNADLPTALLTHGIAVSLLILYLLRAFWDDSARLSTENHERQEQ